MMMDAGTERSSYRTHRSGGVLTLILDRPEHGNSLIPGDVPRLVTLFKEAQLDDAVRCIIIRGEGKHFMTGGDIGSFARGISDGVAALQAEFKTRMANTKGLVEAMVAFDRPIIAVIKGGVAGAGLLFSLAADIVIGDPSSFFLFSHQRMGLSPDAGVSWLLPRMIGLRAAKTLILTMARVAADEALRLGLLTRIVAPEQLDDEAEAMAAKFSKAPQFAIKTAKRLLDGAYDAPLSQQLDAEAEGIVKAVADPDFEEGVLSFLEKRPVNFPSGR